MICGLNNEIFFDLLIRLKLDGSGLTVEEAKAFEQFVSTPDCELKRQIRSDQWHMAEKRLPALRSWLKKETRFTETAA